jgi:hypothetical protein
MNLPMTLPSHQQALQQEARCHIPAPSIPVLLQIKARRISKPLLTFAWRFRRTCNPRTIYTFHSSRGYPIPTISFTTRSTPVASLWGSSRCIFRLVVEPGRLQVSINRAPTASEIAGTNAPSEKCRDAELPSFLAPWLACDQ